MTPSLDLVVQLLEDLERLELKFLVGGSFASSAWGQPPQTNDLDLEILVDTLNPPRLHEVMRDA